MHFFATLRAVGTEERLYEREENEKEQADSICSRNLTDIGFRDGTFLLQVVVARLPAFFEGLDLCRNVLELT